MNVSWNDYWGLLRRYLAPQRGAFLLMAALLLVSIALQLIGPQIVRRFIDALQTSVSTQMLMWMALLFLGTTALQQALTVLASYWSERVAWTATNALRADLTAHLLRLDLGFHKSHSAGELIERVDGDVNQLAGFFSSFVVQLVGSALLLSGVLVAVWFVDWRLGVAFTGFALGTLVLLGQVWRGGTPVWEADRERSANFYGYLGEILAATEDLRSSRAVAYALGRFVDQLRSWLPVARRAAFWGQSVMAAAILAFAIGEALAYGVGGWLYGVGALSLGTVYLVISYMTMLGAPIETIRTQLQDLQQAGASVARVSDLLATPSKLVNTGAQPLPIGPLAVELCQVTFAYADGATAEAMQSAEPVLHDISFQLPAGQVLGVLGRTGSGKSSLARLLFRLYDQQQGRICLGDTDVRQLDLAELRARVGLVTQDVQIFTASLRDNLTFFDPTIADETLLTVLGELGLESWLTRLPAGLDTTLQPGLLSAGEAQLLAVARVFLKDPGLLILDEASSRLDPTTEMLLEGAMDRLLKRGGQPRTAVIIAHRLATVERADQILVLEGGRIVEYGARTTLAADPNSRFAQLRRTGAQELLA